MLCFVWFSVEIHFRVRMLFLIIKCNIHNSRSFGKPRVIPKKVINPFYTITLVWHLAQTICLHMSHFCPLENRPNLVFMQRKQTLPRPTFSFTDPSRGRPWIQNVKKNITKCSKIKTFLAFLYLLYFFSKTHRVGKSRKKSDYYPDRELNWDEYHSCQKII